MWDTGKGGNLEIKLEIKLSFMRRNLSMDEEDAEDSEDIIYISNCASDSSLEW